MRRGIVSIKHRITHLWKRRRNKILLSLACINILLLFLLYSNLFSYPNTYIGSADVSGKSAGQVRAILTKEQSVSPKIQMKNRTYTYTYNQLGVVIDITSAVDNVFAPNRAMFPVNLINFFQSIVTRRHIAPPIVFTQDFDQFVTGTVFNLSLLPDKVTVDPTTKSLEITQNSENYRFDKNSLQELLSIHFGSYEHPIYPMLAKITNETIDQVTDINERLANIFAQPIMMYLDMGGATRAVELKEEDIREATVVSVNPGTTHVTISVNPIALNKVIVRRIRGTGFPTRDSIVNENVQNDFLQAVQLRYSGTNIGAIATTTNEGPNTDGSLADKYIEVDISQQKMYVFKGGSVNKTYNVSTGLEYPTPVGKFAILNKVDLGFSDIYKEWMPWWMGFDYSDTLHAYFGIHEQPYSLSQDGKPVLGESRLGTPTTGGCIALAPGEAQEVYDFASVGTPVYIFN